MGKDKDYRNRVAKHRQEVQAAIDEKRRKDAAAAKKVAERKQKDAEAKQKTLNEKAKKAAERLRRKQ